MFRSPQPLLLAALVLALLAGGIAVRAGLAWYGAAHDASARYSATRDEALAAGEQSVQNLSTLDHRRLDEGLDLWEESTTGELHAQLVEGRGEFERQVREARTVSTAKVLTGAITELDERAGRARVMVALRVTVRAEGREPADKNSRMLGELTRADGRWKLAALTQAPVGDTATAAN
ncbi:nuclear transport factor 2 family protein [Streptomyces sp. Da 82-17]|uniref:nuclear transport factor 2 family protein n=1 Tax=Streptomyces sp. Da 82-17 TaxID=3377116 RepID=UPI0038D46304